MTLEKPLAATAAAAALAVAALTPAMAAASSPAATGAAGCAKGSLALVHAGQLTIATDSPAYPPYFVNNKPSNGEGFESAVGFAIASRPGFAASQRKWTVEPFDSSYAPGPKSFDFDINEISITSARAKSVDGSTPYHSNPQAVVVANGSKYAGVKSLAALPARSSACRPARRASTWWTRRSSRASSRRSSTAPTTASPRCASISSTRSSSTSRPPST